MWHERSSHVAFHVACSHVACHVIWASAKVGSCCVLMFVSGHCTRSAALDCLPMIFTLFKYGLQSLPCATGSTDTYQASGITQN